MIPLEADRNEKKGVVVLSGGLDSSTVCAVAARETDRLLAITFDYGQRSDRELACAKRIGQHYSVSDHLFFELDLGQIGGSALTDDAVEVPVDRGEEDMAGIPTTYVPARNTIFLSIALAWAEVNDADSIYIGVNAIDYSGYPDCRPEYIRAYRKMANNATRRGVQGDPIEIKTPLLDMKKNEIIELGLELGVPYEHTWSCYKDGVFPCGRCDSCILRAKGFEEVGIGDPALKV